MAIELKGKQNNILWLTLGLVGVLVVGYFYVRPTLDELKAARAASAAAGRDLEALNTKISQIQSLNAQLDSNKDAVDKLNLAVPDQAAFDELLVTLNAIASKSGIRLVSLQPTGDKAIANATVEGSYSGIRSFVDNMHKNLRPINVSRLELRGGSNVANASLITVSMTLDPATAQLPETSAQSAAGQIQEGI